MSEPVAIEREVRLPEQEGGVYDLVITASNATVLRLPQPSRVPIAWSKPLAQRRSVVVLRREPPAACTTVPGSGLVEIDPTLKVVGTPGQAAAVAAPIGSGKARSVAVTPRSAGTPNSAPSLNCSRRCTRAKYHGKPTACRSTSRANRTSSKSTIPATCRRQWASASSSRTPLGRVAARDRLGRGSGRRVGRPDGPTQWNRHRIVFWPRSKNLGSDHQPARPRAGRLWQDPRLPARPTPALRFPLGPAAGTPDGRRTWIGPCFPKTSRPAKPSAR